jgi:hypothetical protein
MHVLPDFDEFDKDANQKLMKKAMKNAIYGNTLFHPFKHQNEEKEMKNIYNISYFSVVQLRGHNEGILNV